MFIILFLWFLILFLIIFVSIYITLKIFKLELNKKRFWILFLIILFFPISLFFIKWTYLYFKNNNKINWIYNFIKIILTIFLLLFVFIILLKFSILNFLKFYK